MSRAPGVATPGATSTRRALAGLLAAGALPALLLADTGYAMLRGWREPNVVPRLVLGASLTCLAVLLVCFARAAFRARLARAAPKIAAVVVSIAMSLALGELAVRVLFGARFVFHHHPPNTTYVLHPDPAVITGVSGDAHIRFNALGIRGAELPADRAVRRVLCIGGSTTACFYLDDTETWPALVEAALARDRAAGCWVGNMGYNGYPTPHHLRATRYSPLIAQVDDVVLMVGVNDFQRALAKGTLEGGGGIVPLWWRSALMAAFHDAQNAGRAEETFVDAPGGGAYRARRELRRDARVIESLPDLDAVLAQYRSNIQALAEHVRARGARPLFVTQPTVWSETMTPEVEASLWFGMPAPQEALSVAALAQGMRAFNTTLIDECRALGVDCLDLADLGGDPASFYDDCHFNEEGARRVAARVAARLQQMPR